MRLPLPALSLALLAATSCTVEQPPPVPPPPAPPPPPASYSAQAAEAGPPRVAFENPGGMWMPQQLTEHASTLRSLGLQIDPAELTDPTSKTLGAVVSLGGCSASFVSAEGLIVTNHHCVQGALQQNSTPEKNLMREGFLARNRGEEKSAGPTSRVFVTRSFKDVTAQVLDGLDALKTDKERFDKIEARTKQLTADCERGKVGARCNVAKFFDGAQYFQIESLELRDIRLVYAPSQGVGNYGGEIDNWRWPRHTGDFSFYRAYVGKDGNPADFSPENVPYKPPSHLKLASAPLKEGDLVFVAGYPGRTSRYKTSKEADEAVNWYYPRRLKLFEDYIAAIEEAGKDNPDAALKASTMLRGLHNAQTNNKGQLEGLVKGGLLAQKNKLELDLKTWIDADPARKGAYGGVLEKMASLYDEQSKHRERGAALGELTGFVRLLGAAMTIVRMAEERPKADADRKPDYQERNWKRLEQGAEALEKSYHRSVDRALLSLALRRIQKLPPEQGGEILAAVTGKKKPSDADIARSLDALFPRTPAKAKKPTVVGLEDVKARLKWLREGTTKSLKKAGDPLLDVALRLRPLIKAEDDRDEAYSGAMALLRPKYIAALRDMARGQLAPDANSTLRVTYGTVRGYSPAPGAPVYRPFTLLSEVVAKHTGKEPFDAPAALLDAARANKLGPYADAKLKDLPVNFLADLHITGGNSGSATLNARGELTGLVFDGNYEAMASDWLFTPSITRSIHVDLRYVLWVMDTVDKADHLLQEMGVTPAVE